MKKIMNEKKRHDAPSPVFDEYAAVYDEELQSSFGFMANCTENLFFYKHKVDCIRRYFPTEQHLKILDFGCGCGEVLKELAMEYPESKIVGYDISTEASAIAIKQLVHLDNVKCVTDLETVGKFDLVIVSNVMHHIPPGSRTDILRGVVQRLSKNGYLVVFEHNPFNPLTRKVVSNCKFDENAELLTPTQLNKYIDDLGMVKMKLWYVVYFPWGKRINSILEKVMGGVPFGAQYMAIYKKDTLVRRV